MIFSPKKIFAALSSRVARNIYLWAVLLYVVLGTNYTNEQHYHYGIIQSPWYPWVIVIGTLLQMALLYVNNLLLVPRMLARKKYRQYFLSAFLLLAIVSIVYTTGLKIVKSHLNVDHLQQPGFVSAPVSTQWDFLSLRVETESYFFGNVLWVLVFTMAWYMNDYSRQQKLAEHARKEQVMLELTFLKNQLNPHFLFNTLNNLYSLALKKSDTAPDAILKLSLILRYLLYESDTPLVSFEKEKEIMEAYIDLELLRLKHKDNLHFSITADAPSLIPPLLWLPVLENIFKHGTRIISTEHFVDYRFTIQDERLSIHSRNSAKSQPGNSDNKGIGLENLRKRLRLLYPSAHRLESSLQGNEYITDLNIDLSKHAGIDRR